MNPETTLRAAFTAVAAIGAVACVRAAGPTTVDVDTLTIEHASSPSSSAGAEPSASATPPRARVDFITVSAELTKRCEPREPPGVSNVETKARVGIIAECKGKLAMAEEDRLLDGASHDRARAQALTALVAQYRAWIAPACWLSEEAQWVDFDTGTRDDGTARSYAALACMDATSTERLFFARTLDADDAGGLARHIEAQAVRGAKNAHALGAMRDRAQRLLAEPIPVKTPGDPFFPIILDDAARRELASKTGAVESGATRLAESACRAWPALARALGGPVGCETTAPRYFLAQTPFDRGEAP